MIASSSEGMREGGVEGVSVREDRCWVTRGGEVAMIRGGGKQKDAEEAIQWEEVIEGRCGKIECM